MAYYPLTDTVIDNAILDAEKKGARQIGVIRLGKEIFMFRVGLKTYYIPYGEMKNCFRRVMNIPAKMCCGNGNFRVENLVLSDGEKELAVIQLPGERAAKELIKALKEISPDTDFSVPQSLRSDEAVTAEADSCLAEEAVTADADSGLAYEAGTTEADSGLA